MPDPANGQPFPGNVSLDIRTPTGLPASGELSAKHSVPLFCKLNF